jgi:tetraacyldisaccharide 4'-kinase
MNIKKIIQAILLSPLTLLYAVGLTLSNLLYDLKIFRSVTYDLPIIVIGNLSLGGTGKTPHVEFLIQLLRPYINVATLSRGYKRKTEGYLPVAANMTAKETGDEPLQFKRKFRDVFVTVAENRAFAIPRLLLNAPDTQVILMDDGFQHRSLKPNYSVLLTSHHNLFTDDYLLPSGSLREWRSAYKRANTIIVTKTPEELTREDADKIIKKIAPQANQAIYFSYYKYGNPYYFFNGNQKMVLDSTYDIILIVALANNDYLLNYLDKTVNYARILDFQDHHLFTKSDLANLNKQYEALNSPKKIILTTEKDAVRLEEHRDYIIENQLPIFVLPIEVDFRFGERKGFENEIKQFLLHFKV